MKRTFGVLSLLVLLASQCLAPFTYVYAVTEDGCSSDEYFDETANEGNGACLPRCTEPGKIWDSGTTSCVDAKHTVTLTFDGNHRYIDVMHGKSIKSTIEKSIDQVYDNVDYAYSETITGSNKLKMFVRYINDGGEYPFEDSFLSYSGSDGTEIKITYPLEEGDETVFVNPRNEIIEGDSVYFRGFGYGFHAVITGDLLDVPEREGLTFDGWYTDNSYDPSNKYDITSNVIGDQELFGRYVVKVSFDTRGGNEIAPIYVEANTIISPDDPSRLYSDFAGWYTNTGLTDVFNPSTPVTQNVTLYAKYDCQDRGLQNNASLSGDNMAINECFQFNTLDIGAFTLMDRNLGAMMTGDWNNYSAEGYSSGYFYQWGNNYGFSTNNSSFNSTGVYLKKLTRSNIPYYRDIYGYGYNKYGEDEVNSDWKEDVWGKEYNIDHYIDESTDNDGRQGPCPAGWHIGSKLEWQGIVNYLLNDEMDAEFNYDDHDAYSNLNSDLADYLLISPANKIDFGGYDASRPIYSPTRKKGYFWAGFGYGFSINEIANGSIQLSPSEKDPDFANYDFRSIRCFQDKLYLTFKDWEDYRGILGTIGFDEDSIGETFKINDGNLIPNRVDKNFAWYYTGTEDEYSRITLSETPIENILTQEFTENTTIYVKVPKYELRLHYGDRIEDIDIPYLKDGSDFTIMSPVYDLPTPIKTGYIFMGWYTGTDIDDLGPSYSGAITHNFAEIDSYENLYPHFKKDITIRIKPNHNTIKSGDNEITDDTDDIEITGTIYDNEKYTLTFPQILVNENTPDILGFSTGATYYPDPDEYYQTGSLIELTGSETYYAQTKKDIIFTVVANRNTIKVGDDTYVGSQQYKDSKTVRNGVNTGTFTFPDAIENTETPDVLGFSTGETYHPGEYYQTGTSIILSGSETYYAQTKKDYEGKQAVFLKGQGITQIGGSNEETLYDSCTPATTYNSYVNDTCVVNAPSISVAVGQKPGKWNNEYAGGDNLTLSQATSYFIAGTESNIYSVYYDYNGGSAGASHPSTYTGGETLTISDPSRPGYTFTGWTDQNGNSVVFPINNANGNYHITANWELTPYTITLTGVDGAKLENSNTDYPTSLPCTYEDVFTLDAPVKAGYEFQGWQLEDGTTKKVVTISKTTSDRVLTGVWGSGTYNIVYNLNGGTNDVNNPESYTYSTTEDVILHSGTRVGYSFSGWYDNPNFEGTPVTKIVKESHNHVVLHAKWIQNIYTITFNNVNEATLENTNTPYPLSMTGAYDDVITLSTPSKEGYEFDGWEIGNSSVITKTVTLSKLTENKTITAHWTAKRYTITYYPNGGTNNVNNPESYTYSDTSSVTLYSGTRVGYRFDGWYTSLNGGDEVISIPAEAHENYVLYAHWTANTNTPYKVYHYQESLDGGHLLKDTDSLQGTSDAQVTPAVKSSYDGFTAPSTQTVTIRPDGETRVEYYYNRNSYSITVNYNGGKNSNNQSLVTYTKKYGDTVEEVIPTRDGYSFSGWSEAYPKTMPVVEGTEPKTITALWTANAYTITYNNVEYADNYNTRYGYNTSESFELSGAVWTGYNFDGWFTQAVGGTQVTAITANDHENKVLYAHWTPKTNIKYTVIHRRQGLDQYYNDDSLKEEVEYTNGVTATTIEAEQKNYPGFIPPEVKEITIKGDGTSVVEYRYQRMRFTYASEGNVGVDTKGTTANNQYMFYGAPLTLRATVDTGYSWSGWYIETGDNVYRLFTTEQNTTIGLPAYNSVVKPVVTHDLYTLSFDAHGGIATGTSSLVAQNHYYNDEITLPEVVKTGYIFQGWYTEPNGQGIKYEADTKMPVGNVELHAYWIEGEVNVKVEYYLMNLDGVTYPEQPSDKLELQKTTNSIYTGEVKTFKGFTLSGDEQSVQVDAEGTSVIKYYYKRNSYSLDLRGLTGFNYVSVVSTNHPDGVEIISGVVQPTNYYYGETITITGELLTGYGMDKWNGTEDIGKNSGTPVFTFTMPAKTVELTPNVTKNTYKATYKDGDRVIVVYDVVYEDVVPTPTAPSKYGYKFTGWRYYPVSGTMPANNIEIQAMWESVPVNNGGGGGGGGSSSSETKKVIINTTGDKQQEHNSAELTGTDKKIEDTKKVEDEKEPVKSDEVENTITDETTTPTNTTNTSDQSMDVDQEILAAYEWAYKHGVTTMPTLEEANPEGVVTRGHLAKMVVNYAVNVLGQQLPEKAPSECRWNDWRGDWESEEIKDYAVKACSLGLMGLDMKKFQPKLNVTRAQFGTIMSRLLWGKKYAGGTPYYKKHLNALKENNIMTQIQNPEKRTELRQWVWLMLMRSADNN